MENKLASNVGWRAGVTWGMLCGLMLITTRPFIWPELIRWLLQQPVLPHGFLFSTIAWLVPIIVVAGAQAVLGMHVARLMSVRQRSALVTAMLVGAGLWLVYKACVLAFAWVSYHLYAKLLAGPYTNSVLWSDIFWNNSLNTAIIFFSFSYAMCQQLALTEKRL